MDEARRFEDTDKAVMESLARENEYWKRVGGHPPVDENYDAPRVRLCEHDGCTTLGLRVDDGGTMDQCERCDAWLCKDHRVMDHACHTEVCLACRQSEDEARVCVED